ncbi:MAG: hypothetical protein WC683_18320 [bacterium]
MKQLHDTTIAQSAQTQMYDLKVQAIEMLMREFQDTEARSKECTSITTHNIATGIHWSIQQLLKSWFDFGDHDVAVFWDEINDGAEVGPMIEMLAEVQASRDYSETINAVRYGGA